MFRRAAMRELEAPEKLDQVVRLASAPAWLMGAALAVIVAVAEDATAVVVRVNVAVELPAATVTLAGTIAEELLLDSATGTPPAGATLESVTPHVAVAPDPKLVGLHDSEETPTDTTRLIVAGAPCDFAGLMAKSQIWMFSLTKATFGCGSVS